MNDTPWHICVLIPARNEEKLLPRCLRSIRAACLALPRGVTHDVVVIVDSSTDQTLQIAESFVTTNGKVITTEAGVVGYVRALGAETALQRYGGPLDRCWLANTDADCRVPESWLLDQLALAKDGAEAIAGTVYVDSFTDFKPGVAALFRTRYIIHPDDTHPHVHGANLGVRADAYVRAGGWAHLRTAEDHDLWNRLADRGSHGVSVGRVKVLTSGRRVGRAPHGFADTLALHNEALV